MSAVTKSTLSRSTAEQFYHTFIAGATVSTVCCGYVLLLMHANDKLKLAGHRFLAGVTIFTAITCVFYATPIQSPTLPSEPVACAIISFWELSFFVLSGELVCTSVHTIECFLLRVYCRARILQHQVVAVLALAEFSYSPQGTQG